MYLHRWPRFRKPLCFRLLCTYLKMGLMAFSDQGHMNQLCYWRRNDCLHLKWLCTWHKSCQQGANSPRDCLGCCLAASKSTSEVATCLVFWLLKNPVRAGMQHRRLQPVWCASSSHSSGRMKGTAKHSLSLPACSSQPQSPQLCHASLPYCFLTILLPYKCKADSGYFILLLYFG